MDEFEGCSCGGDCEECDCEEDEYNVGDIYCPKCFGFEFSQVNSYIECVECGSLYDLDREELPFVTYEELENAEDN